MYIMYMYIKWMNEEPPTTGSLVWHLAMRWRNEVDRAIAPLGLTHAQYSVLASLHSLTRKKRSPSQKELADYTGLQPIYISKLVRALEAASYIVRRPHHDDSRAMALALSESGLKTVLEARRIVRELDGRLTRAIGGPGSEKTLALAATLRELMNQSRPDGD